MKPFQQIPQKSYLHFHIFHFFLFMSLKKHDLTQSFPNSAYLPLGSKFFSSALHCSIFNRIPGFYLADVSGLSPPLLCSYIVTNLLEVKSALIVKLKKSKSVSQ